MWQWIVTHRGDAELVALCWLAVQVAAGMPTPRESSSTAYKWAFNVAHSFTNLPRLLATAFPEVSWIAAFFGLPAAQARVKSADSGQTTGGGSAK
ncbi:MAG: hypothetical protein ACRD4X_18540 [Candidatus Acidiferrales bacterium]